MNSVVDQQMSFSWVHRSFHWCIKQFQDALKAGGAGVKCFDFSTATTCLASTWSGHDQMIRAVSIL
jgi:hypothetical protein